MICIGVAALGVAVWFFTKKDPEKSFSTDASSNTSWMCDRCHKKIELSAKQVDDWMKSDKMNRDPSKAKIVIFKCPDCGTFSMCRASYCTAHKVYFVEVDSNGMKHYCPDCAKAAGIKEEGTGSGKPPAGP